VTKWNEVREWSDAWRAGHDCDRVIFAVLELDPLTMVCPCGESERYDEGSYIAQLLEREGCECGEPMELADHGCLPGLAECEWRALLDELERLRKLRDTAAKAERDRCCAVAMRFDSPTDHEQARTALRICEAIRMEATSD